MRRLINDTSYTFYRDPSEQVLDEYGNLVDPQNLMQVTTRGSMQSYQDGAETFVLPEGVRSEGTRIYVTKSVLLSAQEGEGIKADFTLIDGRRFYVFDVQRDDTSSLLKRTRNNTYILLEDTTQDGQEVI